MRILQGNNTKRDPHTKRINKTNVERAQPNPAGKYVIMDNKLEGFGLRVYPSGHKAYVIRYYTKTGEQRFHTVGSAERLTADQARAVARIKLGLVETGGDPAKDDREARQAITFGELVSRFMELHAKPKKRSWKDDEQRLRDHVLPNWKNRKASGITAEDVAKLHHAIRQTMRDRKQAARKDLKPLDGNGTANRVIAVVSKVFNLAEKWGIRPRHSNPCHGLEKFPERARDSWVRAEHFAALVKAILDETGRRTGTVTERILDYLSEVGPQTATEVAQAVDQKPSDAWNLLRGLTDQGLVERLPDKRYRALFTSAPLSPEATYYRAYFLLLLLTGCRRSELLNARWENVHLEQRLLHLPEADTKTAEARAVPLPAEAVEILRGLPRVDGNPYVFPSTKPSRKNGEAEPKPLNGINNAWERIRDRAGLPGLRIHDLRHTYATHHALNGTGLPVLGQLLGHKSPLTTQRYAHRAESPLRLASDRMGAIFATLAPALKVDGAPAT